MSNLVELTIEAESARLNGFKTFIETGAGTAQLRLISAPRPPRGAAYTGVVLVSYDLPNPCGTIVGTELTLALPAWINVAATGTISFGRIITRAGGIAADMDAGLVGSGYAIEINSFSVIAGGLIYATTAIIRA